MTKSYSRSFPGQLSFSEVNVESNGMVYPNSGVRPVVAAVDTLSWASVNGNHRTPNPHSWGYTQRGYLQGSISGRTSPVVPYQESNQSGVLFGADDGLNLPSLVPGRLSYNQALSRLNNRVRGSLNLSVDALEYKSTARMFNLLATARGAAAALTRAARRPAPRVFRAESGSNRQSTAIQREFYLNRRKFGSELNNAYLSTTFGWGPLLSSLYGVADELIRPAPLSNVSRLTGSYRASSFDSREIVKGNPLFSKADALRILVEDRVEDFTRIGITVTNNQSSIDTRRWVSYSPLSTAYELLPYSFVVDYFWNLGGYLSDLETSWMFGSSFVTGYVSRGSSRRAFANIVGVQKRNPFTRYTAYGSGYIREGVFNRTLLTSYPTPEVPRFSFDLGSRQCINIASLLAQVFLRK